MNLLDIPDLGADGVRAVLDLSTRPIKKLGRPLEGQGVALIFEKPSNRTRQSMEVAVVQLGGHPVTPEVRRSASTCASRSRTSRGSWPVITV